MKKENRRLVVILDPTLYRRLRLASLEILEPMTDIVRRALRTELSTIERKGEHADK